MKTGILVGESDSALAVLATLSSLVERELRCTAGLITSISRRLFLPFSQNSVALKFVTGCRALDLKAAKNR